MFVYPNPNEMTKFFKNRTLHPREVAAKEAEAAEAAVAGWEVP
jgi:hypothetical protein